MKSPGEANAGIFIQMGIANTERNAAFLMEQLVFLSKRKIQATGNLRLYVIGNGHVTNVDATTQAQITNVERSGKWTI